MAEKTKIIIVKKDGVIKEVVSIEGTREILEKIKENPNLIDQVKLLTSVVEGLTTYIQKLEEKIHGVGGWG